MKKFAVKASSRRWALVIKLGRGRYGIAQCSCLYEGDLAYVKAQLKRIGCDAAYSSLAHLRRFHPDAIRKPSLDVVK